MNARQPQSFLGNICELQTNLWSSNSGPGYLGRDNCGAVAGGVAVRYPSVTTVLSPWQDFSQVPEDVLCRAKDRGSRVHAAAAAYALDVWSPKLPEELQGYFTSFQNWFDAYVDKVVLVEPEMVSEELGYCGHPDLLCKIKGDYFITIVDLKTPLAAQKSWAVQCAAYWRIARGQGHDVNRNLSLRLRPDGKPALVTEYSGNYNFDLGIFLNALAVFNYFNG